MLILIPILAMLTLEFVAVGTQKARARFFFLVCGGITFLFLILRSFLSASWVDPEGEAVVRVQSQVHHLLQQKKWQEHPVILFIGSSATQYGVNGKMLEQFLADAGLPVTVLQFSLSGANHFERLFMLRLFLEKIGAQHREELKKAPTIMLCEVFDAYDESPLYLFKKEAYTRRAITWFEPKQAWAAWKAWRASEKRDNISSWSLWEHFLLNRFAVGSFSALKVPSYGKEIESFFPLAGTKKTFHYHSAEKTFRTTTISLPQELYPGWKSYYQTLFQEMGGVVHSCGFYALPTLEPQRRAYQESFAKVIPPHTMMLGPIDQQIMESFLRPEYWFDGVHPQGQGSILVTSWLGQEILKKWLLLFQTRWQINP